MGAAEIIKMEYSASRVMHVSRDDELAAWYQSMAFFTMVGVCLHFGYHLVRPNDEASAKNGLASSVTTAIFLVNWIGIKCSADGVHYFSAGILSGACAGYELYACLNELLNLSNGLVRTDMIFHHGLCLVFIVCTGYIWGQLPEGDIIYWAIVWDSIAISLASNVALNMRLFCKGTDFQKPADALFALHFLLVRVVEQLPFFAIAFSASGPIQATFETGTLVFGHTLTAFVFGAWVMLMVLNFFWAYKVVAMVFKTLTRKPRPKAEQKKE